MWGSAHRGAAREMIGIKSGRDLEGMRVSGRLAAEVRERVVRFIGPGMTTREVEAFAEKEITGRGAECAFLGYRGYPGSICVSVNETVVHGIPGARRISVGDIVSVDIGVRYDGFIGDTAATVMVGVTDTELIRLVKTAEAALEAGIRAARGGSRLGDVSHAVESVTVSAGFSVVREFVGHGIGRRIHEDPQIPNFGKAGTGPVLKAGMTLAIEPMINMGKAEVECLDDGWTVVTRDRKPSAHFEHTIAVTDGEAEVLTAIGKRAN